MTKMNIKKRKTWWFLGYFYKSRPHGTFRVERNHLSTNTLHKPRAAKGEHVVQTSRYISTHYAPRSKNRAARNMHTAKG